MKFEAGTAGAERSSGSDHPDLRRGSVVLTPRLELRLPSESDRNRFVELFCNEDFDNIYRRHISRADAAAPE